MIAVVIVNWNGAEDTIECLESLTRIAREDVRIIVCDNGSRTPLGPRLAAWAATSPRPDEFDHPAWRSTLSGPRHWTPTLSTVPVDGRWEGKARVTLVDIGYNAGFARANNIGIAMALGDPRVDRVWLLNNDTIVEPGALDALIMRLEEDETIGAAGSTLDFYDQPGLLQGVGGNFSRMTARSAQIAHLASLEELPDRAAAESRIDFVIGASVLARRSFLTAVGEMDERYFLYFEELDWAARAHGKWRLGWAPGSIVHHKEGASIGTNSAGRHSDVAIFYLHRSMILFYAKNLPALLPIALAKAGFTAMRYLARRDMDAMRRVIQGVQSGVAAIVTRPHAEREPPHERWFAKKTGRR